MMLSERLVQARIEIALVQSCQKIKTLKEDIVKALRIDIELKAENSHLQRQLDMFQSCQLTKRMQYAAELSTRRLADIHVLLSEYASDAETESHTGQFEDQNPERLVEFQDV